MSIDIKLTEITQTLTGEPGTYQIGDSEVIISPGSDTVGRRGVQKIICLQAGQRAVLNLSSKDGANAIADINGVAITAHRRYKTNS